jgi:major membrane immunogen (membrane-anchored lipoprotein)
MKRVIAVVTICILLLLVACESKTTGKRVAIPETSGPKVPSGAATIEAPEPEQTTETGKSAAEMLKELQSSPTATVDDGTKSGTFYPPVTVTGTEREALKEKTRALFTQSTYDPNVEADDDFGARYHDGDGDLKNLPDDYEDNEGD